MSDKKITLVPYLYFRGNCEEALNTYKKIIGGNIEIVNRYDNPAMKAPEEYKNKILHAKYEFGGNTILASDVMPGSKSGESGDAYMSLAVSDSDEAMRIFNSLSEGGIVRVPLKKQFWGGWHGNFTDRFGIKWMVNCE